MQKTLELAIQLEIEGQKYYLEQANKNKDNELFKVFNLLADAEKEHEKLLRKRLNDEDYVLDNSNIDKIKEVFNGLKNFDVKNTFKTTQLDVYRLAVDIEEKSIKLYQDMLKEADNDKDKELLKFLINEENQHLILFEEFVKMVSRPEEWVESAEFGLREDY
ncbi:rubrerythrin [Herbinix hemicellulosilytica]|uniref:Rubrerythrin diiron-binding domain-containing protein n=1 Tax=Herbinix hemicellulosilytica TaxID=1564487 RepID=A0A0H5SGV9_HERHM|nr:ferritin family protein [Herbinix hemicellulosilytica]RBP59583.1 rubrerythrin [Herbinix hemicellulosilytica]CRZ34704.1 hypothetical protein HHT355_1503 [Herbinix hemicellulosilytica]